MASFKSEITNGNISGFISATSNAIAVLHCKVEKNTGFFSKIIIRFSLDANWVIMYNGKQILLNKINVQVGYKNDSGDINYKNSAIVANKTTESVLRPMIWTKDNCANVFQATYTASPSLMLLLTYTVAFEINADLPKELQNAYTENQELSINPEQPYSDYSIKICLI